MHKWWRSPITPHPSGLPTMYVGHLSWSPNTISCPTDSLLPRGLCTGCCHFCLTSQIMFMVRAVPGCSASSVSAGTSPGITSKETEPFTLYILSAPSHRPPSGGPLPQASLPQGLCSLVFLSGSHCCSSVGLGACQIPGLISTS